MSPQETLTSIKDIIVRLMRMGLADEQRYPELRLVSHRRSEIIMKGSPDLSVSMRDKPYVDIYAALEKEGAYNIKMIDGSLIQMVYTFTGRHVSSHRLCLFPRPDLPTYEDGIESYEADESLADIVGCYSVKVPVRIDYSDNAEEHQPVDHPMSHLTLGQYKGCRIPVIGPVTPLRFMQFVLRNFYNPAYSRVNIDAEASRSVFPESITAEERCIAHIAF